MCYWEIYSVKSQNISQTAGEVCSFWSFLPHYHYPQEISTYYFLLAIFGSGEIQFFAFIEVTDQNTFLIGTLETFPVDFEAWQLDFSLKSMPEPWQPWHFWLCWISRCFKFHMLFGKRTSRGRQKEVCLSWWTTSKRGEREGYLCRPNALHTSLALGFHPCYHDPSQFPDSLLQEYQFGFLLCGKGTLCPT